MRSEHFWKSVGLIDRRFHHVCVAHCVIFTARALIFSSKVDSLDHNSESDEAAKTRASYVRQLRLRWLRLISHARQDHRGASVRGIGIGGESGSSGHTTPGSEGSLRGRFNWVPSGGLNWGPIVGF